MKKATLTTNHFNQQKGTQITILSFEGSSRFKVQFADKTTDIIGKSKFQFDLV